MAAWRRRIPEEHRNADRPVDRGAERGLIMRAAFIAILWMAGVIGSAWGGSRMDDLSFPPPRATPDEQSVSDHTGFEACEAAIRSYAALGKMQITERKYSVSAEWGRILRAKVEMRDHGVTTTALLRCWTGSGPGVRILLDFASCGPRRPRC